MEYDVLDYHNLIFKEACRCYYRLCDYSSYTKEDLAQEGVLEFYKAIKSYDPSKSKVSTFLTTVLRNFYSKVVMKEYKQKLKKPNTKLYDILMEKEKSIDKRYYTKKDFEENVFSEKLSAVASDVVNIIIETNIPYKERRETFIKKELGISQSILDKTMKEIKRKY